MNFPANILLYLFAAVFLGLVIMSVVHLFHAWRFGEHTPLAAITSGLFLLGIFLLIGAATFLLRDIDWAQSFTLEIPFLTTASSPTP